ncbi:alpha/beta hydrolase [Litoribacillus peritrichatus]|uniref:Esterase EstB n=1 Tax=Litoribacillus peritrichatus TaxID=718191 RepID=A0ABP7MQL0_9GAMM
MQQSLRPVVVEPTEYFIEANGLKFCVEERGNPNGPPIVLIMGLACQMISWPESLLNGLAAQGYRVIRFDNRDVGLTDKLQSHVRVDIRLAFLFHKFGLKPRANYTLHDMAEDTACLMDALGIDQAHVVGVSMGGMIAQLLASHYRHKVASLTAMMSSTNSARLPLPEFSLMLKLGAPASGHHEKAVVKRWIRFWQAIQSPEYPTSLADVTGLVEAMYQRNYCAGGTLRQLQAILATGSLEQAISRIQVPTLVIHGSCDPLLKPACGKAIHRKVPGARFKLVRGLGHDLPEALVPEFVSMIDGHAKDSVF